MAPELNELLDYLEQAPAAGRQEWGGWSLDRVSGGANNLLYHVWQPGVDLAVKLTIRDGRRRAWREHAALSALRAAGLILAPDPILLDETRSQPVIIQSWLPGKVCEAAPTDDIDWQMLLEHYAQIHSITPENSNARLERSVFTFSNCAEGKTLVWEHALRIPNEFWPVSMDVLLAALENWDAPVWNPPELVLCRADPNFRNFLRREHGWVSVDWENSGWGDAAFEIADLMTHPSYAGHPSDRLEWFASAYSNLQDDPGFIRRVQADCTILLAWWAVRFARYLYEIPRGLDQRLAQPPADWSEGMAQKYHQTLEKAIRRLKGKTAGG